MSHKQNIHHLFLFTTLSSIVFIFSSSNCVSGLAQPYHALVAPITKDLITSLFSITLNIHEKYVIDLGGPFLWYRCPKKYPTVPCASPACSSVKPYFSPLCPSLKSESRAHCKCVVTPVNPVTNKCSLAHLTHKDLSISWTNGSTPATSIAKFKKQYVSCAPQSLLNSLPVGVSGMAGLSRSLISVSSQFMSPKLKIKKQFSVCLPSSDSAPGVMFFGDGPFRMVPPTPADILSFLAYTPLVKKPKSGDYYINLKGINVNNNKVVSLGVEGNGGVKLSTVVPYTTLSSPIYKPVFKAFVKATYGIPRAPRVKPFKYCLNTTNLGSTRVGLPVASIDLVLGNGRNWTIFGANSMKQVSDYVACLAFVDGGPKAKQPVVLGSFQIENNFLSFDLEKSRLGFSSSLFFIRTTCGNFNFKGEMWG
ncbi:hypothetical protein MKW98_015529 [Papaver atlanticum]|uniref:Peptidase A1 domain-containing protein n=1 Tax=Papaver atlanticum TaxID=357466 RepID=A0AAD4S534_9MAGN|nr:hypothetical protein MKW98_015529 [Papaver atlanticum]